MEITSGTLLFWLIYSILIPEKPNPWCVFDTTTLVSVVIRGVGGKKPGEKTGGMAFWEMAELEKGGGGNQFFPGVFIAITVHTLSWLDCKIMMVFKRLT